MNVDKPHIQMPKSIMERFSHRNKPIDGKTQPETVYVLNLFNNDIKEKKINELGTAEKGYYTEELEKLFGNIESTFGNVRYNINKSMKNKNISFSFTENVHDIIFAFLDNMLHRSEKYYQDFNNNNVWTPAFGGDLSKSQYLLFHQTLDIPLLPFFSVDIKQTHRINIIINSTEKNFVASRNCFYLCENDIIMPISPKIAIVALPIEKIHKCFCLEDGVQRMRCIGIKNENDILDLNKKALLFERIYNNSFIIAHQEDELKELLEYYKKSQSTN